MRRSGAWSRAGTHGALWKHLEMFGEKELLEQARISGDVDPVV